MAAAAEAIEAVVAGEDLGEGVVVVGEHEC